MILVFMRGTTKVEADRRVPAVTPYCGLNISISQSKMLSGQNPPVAESIITNGKGAYT
jgi:hypothetical protein